MGLSRALVSGFYGCWRLFRLDPDGLAYLEDSAAGAARSFWAAAATLPFYAFVVAVQVTGQETVPPLPRAVAVLAIAYVVIWTAYPLLMAPVTDFLDRKARYPRYLCAHNWSQLIVSPIGAAAVAIALVSGSYAASVTALITATVIQLGYEGYIARHALGVPILTAAGLMALKLSVALIVQNAANQLAGLAPGAAA